MEDFTLRMIWELNRISDLVGKQWCITGSTIEIGDFKYRYGWKRLDESFTQAIGAAHVYYKRELYDHKED